MRSSTSFFSAFVRSVLCIYRPDARACLDRRSWTQLGLAKSRSGRGGVAARPNKEMANNEKPTRSDHTSAGTARHRHQPRNHEGKPRRFNGGACAISLRRGCPPLS
jgi:hypothetical protein